jgi:hypothetical protein
MATVYSTKLFSAPAFSGAAVVQYTVPAGFRTVVNTLTMTWGDVTLTDLDCWIQTADLTKLTRRAIGGLSSDPQVLGASLTTYARWTLAPGDTLACQTSAGTVDFYASGFELALP